MRKLLVWILAPVLAAPFVVWRLLADPSTRLAGMILLAALIGFACVFVVPAIIFQADGEFFRESSRWTLLGAGICLTVAVLSIMGSNERDTAEYVWKYGKPGQVEIPRRLLCKLGRLECEGDRASGDKSGYVKVRLSREEFEDIRGTGPLTPGQADATVTLNARILGNRATTAGLEPRPASSVVLGKIPAYVGWIAGVLGLAGALFAPLLTEAWRFRSNRRRGWRSRRRGSARWPYGDSAGRRKPYS